MRRRCSHPSGERADDRSLTGEWSLFLAPRYGAAAWSVRTEQPASIALSTLNSFERTLPLVTLVGIVTALLLSTVQIRRSHRPLALLTDAVERMGRRGLHRRVTVDTKDEYENLAQAFNRMAGGLARQFELFRTLARIDRMILDDPSTEVLVEKILPALPALLHTRAVAVAVAARNTGTVAIWWSSSAATVVSQLQTDALTIEALTGRIDVRIPAFTGSPPSARLLSTDCRSRSRATCAAHCCSPTLSRAAAACVTRARSHDDSLSRSAASSAASRCSNRLTTMT